MDQWMATTYSNVISKQYTSQWKTKNVCTHIQILLKCGESARSESKLTKIEEIVRLKCIQFKRIHNTAMENICCMRSALFCLIINARRRSFLLVSFIVWYFVYQFQKSMCVCEFVCGCV